jgi:hypothetical protein
MASSPRSARLLRALLVASCLFPLVQACGRSEPGDYLYNADGTISEGARGNTTAGRGSTTTGGTRNGTAGASSTGGIGTGATGPIGFGGTAVVGGGGPIPHGGSASVGGRTGTRGTATTGGISSAGAPAESPITCGSQTCDGNTQVCCAGLGGIGCIGINQDCGGAVLGCTVNEDCAGNDICCISITGDVNAASSCKARCDTMGNGRDRQLCQTADECLAPFRFCTPTIFGVNICTRRP